MLKSIDLFFDKQKGSELINYIQSVSRDEGVMMKEDHELELDVKQIDNMHI